jgi:ligand-binding sensor domain-containing protein
MSSGKLSAVKLPEALQSFQVNDLMYRENSNELWMATSNGLWRLSSIQHGLAVICDQPVKALSSSDITVIKRIGDNTWVGTGNDGILLLKANGELNQYSSDEICGYSLKGQRINHISFGRDESIWVSTASGLYA